MARKERIFNQRKRRVFRHQIPTGEVGFGIFFLAFVALMGWWFVAQRDNYDPGERDIDIEVLVASAVEDRLYKSPLQYWVDPSQARSGGPAAPDYGIFPETIFDGGWDPSSRLQTFDEGTLFEKINGAADQYFQYGFELLHFVSIKNADGHEINIEIYDMGAFPNALGIFAAQRSAGRSVDKMGAAWYYETGAGALGIVDKYYFKMAGNSSDQAIQDKALLIVGAMNRLSGSGDAVAKTFQALTDDLGIPFDGITFEKSDVFQYDFAKDFWFGQPDASSELRYYIHFAASEEDALETYRLLHENMLYDYALVDETENSALLKHKFIDSIFTLNREGATIFGVEGADDADAAAAAQATFAKAMFDE